MSWPLQKCQHFPVNVLRSLPCFLFNVFWLLLVAVGFFRCLLGSSGAFWCSWCLLVSSGFWWCVCIIAKGWNLGASAALNPNRPWFGRMLAGQPRGGFLEGMQQPAEDPENNNTNELHTMICRHPTILWRVAPHHDAQPRVDREALNPKP